VAKLGTFLPNTKIEDLIMAEIPVTQVVVFFVRIVVILAMIGQVVLNL
jgi:hypothetical protein